MRRTIFLLLLLLTACRAQQTPAESNHTVGTPTAVVTPSPELATETATTAPKPESTFGAPWPFNVYVHPEGGLFVGDLISFEVGSEVPQQAKQVMISIEGHSQSDFGTQPFTRQGFSDRSVAAFRWVWDTTDFSPGEYHITVKVIPDGPIWNEAIELQSTQRLLEESGDTAWEVLSNQCCRIYYLTGTAAQRDLVEISSGIDDQAEFVSELMDQEFIQAPEVVLIPRVIGQGGFTSDEVYVSYLDRNYTSNSFYHVLRHEMVHLLDRQMDGGFRPPMLAEGYAVFLSGGHYKPEELMPRAAALLSLERYIPLPALAEEFYFFQHEVSYLQAGALIEFMIDEWGRESFEAFYRNIDVNYPHEQVQAIDRALHTHFGLTIEELDAIFVYSLTQFDISDDVLAEVEFMIAFYDTVRRYQEIFDRAAHFQYARFLDIDDMWERQITADYSRKPSTGENIVLEIMLKDAGRKMAQGEIHRARELLASINSILSGFQTDHPFPIKMNHLGSLYHDIVILLLELGYNPQQITMDNEMARAIVRIDGPDLIELLVVYDDGVWKLLNP